MKATSVCEPVESNAIPSLRKRPAVPRNKRYLDITIILLAAPAIAPVMAVVALLIKMVSTGPLLFRQQRVGLGGRRFDCLKFRTMHVNAPTSVHEHHFAELIRSDRPMVKLDGEDPRLIPFARLLRAAGLDELPQLFNVLRGEMSLVGPRPSTLNEYDSFSPRQRGRTNGLPGLTGLWQVNGKNRTTFSEMIELDLHYLRSQCLWLDLGILLRTPIAVTKQLLETAARKNGTKSSASAGRAHRRRKAPEASRTPVTNPAA